MLRGSALLRRRQHRDLAAHDIFVELDIFLDRVHLALARTDGDGGDAVLVQPVGIEPAGREHQVRLHPQRLERLGGAAHDGRVVGEVEGRIGLDVGELHLRHCAVRCRHGLLRLLEGLGEGFGDLAGEGQFGAPRLAAHPGIVGHDVCGVARGLAVLAAEDADVGRALARGLLDLAEPAVTPRVRQPQRADERCRNALVGCERPRGRRGP